MLVMAKAKTRLKTLREELSPKVSQEDLARNANITLATYRNAEGGKNVSYSTATGIRNALNSVREERGLPPVNLEDLELHIV